MTRREYVMLNSPKQALAILSYARENQPPSLKGHSPWC